MSQPSIVAHRAGTTVADLQATASASCDVLEVDVHQTADDVLVLASNPAYQRTTPPTPWPEVEYAGSNSNGPPPSKYHATVADALTVAADRDLGLMIDVKRGPHCYANIETALSRAISDNPSVDPLIVLSYDHAWIKEFTNHLETTAVDAQTGLLFVAHLHDLSATIEATGVDLIETQPRFVTERVQQTLSETDTSLAGWATTSRTRLEEQLALRVDYLKTDKPQIAAKLLETDD